MPPLTPEQAQKLAEQQKIINDDLIRTQALTKEIFEENVQITKELQKSIDHVFTWNDQNPYHHTIYIFHVTKTNIDN